ncbi:Threonylcarbamoyl-AMP synthase [Abortiporus biennis]
MQRHTRVLKCDPASISFSPSGTPIITDSDTEAALRDASRLLHELEPVAFPTETVYGLGALALDESAASKIFSTKGRPADNPLIVHVSSQAMLRRLLPEDYVLPKIYEVLMDHFWPGALTLLFPTEPSVVPSIITAGQPTVAVRMPSHPVARALIAVSDAPIAAPSANSSGKPSPTRAEHVYRDLDGKLDLILDGGPCDVGLESTVVDGLNADGDLRVLRPGGITVEDLQSALQTKADVLGRVPRVLVHRRDYKDEVIEQAPTTPGMKYRHYSPSVPVMLIYTSSPPPEGTSSKSTASLLQDLKARHGNDTRHIKVGVLAPSDSPFLKITDTDGVEWRPFTLGTLAKPSITAQRLFDGLLTLEKENVDVILVEEVKEEREGLAVMNRVTKAAGASVWLA